MPKGVEAPRKRMALHRDRTIKILVHLIRATLAEMMMQAVGENVRRHNEGICIADCPKI